MSSSSALGRKCRATNNSPIGSVRVPPSPQPSRSFFTLFLFLFRQNSLYFSFSPSLYRKSTRRSKTQGLLRPRVGRRLSPFPFEPSRHHFREYRYPFFQILSIFDIFLQYLTDLSFYFRAATDFILQCRAVSSFSTPARPRRPKKSK